MEILSILIPTYNRAIDLRKNLLLLIEIINSGKLHDTVCIIISNNCSTDETKIVLENIISEVENVNIISHEQDRNIGLEQNALFVLKNSITDYVMYLGDDDYISYEYLVRCMFLLKNENISCLIPSYIPVLPNGEVMRESVGRDVGLPTKVYKKGFLNCLENSWRGHQLSGLVFKRSGLLESYHKYRVNNIYPFIFFTAYSCLNGNTIHLTDFPVLITQPGQDKKDWNYGGIGLLDEIFNNYIKLPISQLKITKLEFKVIDEQVWRIKNSLRNGKMSFFRTIISVWFARNTTFYFHLYFPFYMAKRMIRAMFS